MANPDPGARFVRLLDVMSRLRGEGGCPWDREQTRDSLKPFLIEEAYEVLEALEDGDPARLKEELGDLLFQVVFHVEIARERGEFAMADLLSALIDKMIRRHPHVFGDRNVKDAQEALAQWETIKQAEAAGDRRSILHGIPRTLPALLRAQRVQHRASRVGFDWAEPAGAVAKVREEIAELEAAAGSESRERVAAELGDLLFAVVNVARLLDVEPEAALTAATARFQERFRRIEAAAEASGRELRALSPEEMERLWSEAKAREREP